MLELDQVVAAFLGALLALAAQWLVARARRAATARSLSIAFWEELSAAQFGAIRPANPGEPVNFIVGGFSSQTFDSLFHEMAVSLPDSLARDLMRYHWRLKLFMVEQSTHGHIDARFAVFYQEAKALHEGLLPRLKTYGGRGVVRSTIRGRE